MPDVLRNSSMRFTLCFLVVAMLAGCVQGNRTDNAPAEPGEQAPPEQGSSEGLEPDPMPVQFNLNGCTGMVARFGWPGETGPGEAPNGWDYTFMGRPGIGSDSTMMALHCERGSWGHFERPMTTFVEYHSRAVIPEECQKGSEASYVLHQWWTADWQLAAFLRDQYRMPVVLAGLEVSWRNDTMPTTQTWTLTPVDGQQSTVTSHSTGIGQFQVGFHERLAFENGQGISYIQFNATSATMEGDQPLASGPLQLVTGSLHSPTLYSTKAEAYQSQGARLTTSDWNGDIKQFRDLQCTSPM